MPEESAGVGEPAAEAGRENGQRLGLRFRRGSRGPARGGDIPLIGVVQIEAPAPAEPVGVAVAEEEAPAEAPAPKKRTRARAPRKKAAAPAASAEAGAGETGGRYGIAPQADPQPTAS